MESICFLFQKKHFLVLKVQEVQQILFSLTCAVRLSDKSIYGMTTQKFLLKVPSTNYINKQV